MIRFARTKMRGYHYDPRDGGFSLALLSSQVSSMNATSPAPIAELHHPAFRWANTMLANIKNSLLATHRVSPLNIYRATSAPSLGGSTDALSSKQSTSASPSRRRQRRRCPTSSSNWLRLDGKQELYYHVEDHSPGQAR
jgi:hypothetical protein